MQQLDKHREAIRNAYLAYEASLLAQLQAQAELDPAARAAIEARAVDLVRKVRGTGDPGLMEEFLAEYGLSTKEGVALMCLAEALLRVPDAETVDELIQDKITPHDWGSHLGEASSSLVNASTWALMLTGRVIDEREEPGVVGALHGLVRRLGEPVVRVAVGRAMREMGAQFVLGRDIAEALARGRKMTERGYTYSYDMLGEAARTDADAKRYHRSYVQAIEQLAREARSSEVAANPGISVKLSALHPRYEFAHKEAMMPLLVERTLELARAARDGSMGFNIDAEEADRLDLSLDVIEMVLADPSLRGWDGFGVVVQAYGRRAAHVIDWLAALAEHLDRQIMVRLVKGAYWDTEIKRAQVMGLAGFPVFTRKTNTDIAYLACARKLLARRDRIYPQFATHNAHSAAGVLQMAGSGSGLDRASFEFQRLHGMGDALHDVLRQQAGTRCRIYAPVGAHRDLLAYLVRRLLENGANSSFVHQIVNEEVAPEEIARDPFAVTAGYPTVANEAIERPDEIFGALRRNSKGWDLTDPVTLQALRAARSTFKHHRWQAAPILARPTRFGAGIPAPNPSNLADIVGDVATGTPEDVDTAVGAALEAQPAWAAKSVNERASILMRAADLCEANTAEFLELACREAGKSWLDGIAEIREAVDFLNYYAARAEAACDGTDARGVIVCISPWNFPLAIFTGQIAAALVTGNAVLAKPAEQTPLIAARAVELLHEAGIPRGILQLLPGDGPGVGGPLTSHPAIAGVAFTGSLDVAHLIDRQLAETASPDAALIAETGGINAMIVDSTALPEQAVRDILASAFQSAGQRCSALRMLYIQKDVEERLLAMLEGAMETLVVGDPAELRTDVGPVIEREAQAAILAYCEDCARQGRVIKRLEAPESGYFVGPHLIRVGGIDDIPQEVFGPVLHIARFDADKIDAVIEAINAKGYGLTFGLHTRIDGRVQYLLDRIDVGNAYVNRNQIGAVVGSQPFGGEGLSGTGPKAGGPHYLRRFRQSERLEASTPEGDILDRATVRQALAKLQQGRGKLPDRQALRALAPEAFDAASEVELGPIDLPGPTGESNRLQLVPRGLVLCLGGDPDTVIGHAVQARLMGNKVLVIAADVADRLRGIDDIDALDGTLDPDHLTSLEIDAVAASGPEDWLRRLRRALAARDGKIVPLVIEGIYPEAFVLERAVCIDTTAAGGNAALLAKSS